ncbi:hypothetical protein LQ757_06970 [Agromyces sp. SYSU K20354]|uniref:hypothetical protein n=1 Tax=Agromyces cavernae TaxID=2898659 RepID=UPI001E57EEA3|nr:hypothetical protein [Agromyces cavernae]MCD2442018.1 hypothetical protein [Agromyces cavernae]
MAEGIRERALAHRPVALDDEKRDSAAVRNAELVADCPIRRAIHLVDDPVQEMWDIDHT